MAITHIDIKAAPASFGRIVSRLAFLNRFSDAEAVAIDLASVGTTVEAATIRRYLSKINAAEDIRLDLPETRQGVQSLELAGLLAAGRSGQILDTPVTLDEVPTSIKRANGWA